ncbi:MAG: FprA family A-type flavoprotein [ANME-2 cluster archaeon]|nr:FprA family A-type flavoprotein [ANME-2 cluster archaeon]
MGENSERITLTKGVYWVGAIDWNLRDFHGYVTPRGTTYNAYLIVDEKVALVDTVNAEFAGEMMERIRQIIDPAKIDYVVANHVEMDHSGSLPAVMEAIPGAKIYGTRQCKNGLSQYYHAHGFDRWDFEIVETGSELNLGTKTLMFIEAAMLHWPDSMHTYIKEDKILLSNDAFGQHVATSNRFNDEVDDVMEDAAEYYANILMPFGKVILKYVGTVGELGIGIDMIAPCHGIIWRKDPGQIIEAYGRWASGENIPKVLVIYDTMWGSTHMMARSIVEGVTSTGVDVKLINIRKNDLSKIIKEILDAPVVLVGSPTLNNGMFPSVGEFLTYLKGLHPAGKKAAVFGSYGWGGGAVKAVEKELEAAGFELIEPGFQVRYRPDKEGLEKCRMMGERVAAVVKAM